MSEPFAVPSDQEQLEMLFRLGYFRGKEWDEVRHFLLGEPEVKDAVEEYRDFHGLNPGDSIDDEALTQMLRPRCGLPDFIRDPQSAVCKWPMLNVTTSHRLSGLNPLSADIEHQAWLEAIAAWNAVCGIKLSFIEDMSVANIYANPGTTGAGVLAYSYLPCGATPESQMQQVYNKSINWNYRLLVNVLIHEIGHAKGLDHGPRGSIMQPTADGTITRPQLWDINEAVKRYGAPSPTDPPAPPPPTPSAQFEVFEILKPGKYRLIPSSDLNMG